MQVGVARGNLVPKYGDLQGIGSILHVQQAKR
jgi:hypothetical protein